MDKHDERAPTRTEHPVGEQHHAASGGDHYQTAHREHAHEREGHPANRAARGTGPKSGRPDTLPTDAPATGAADQPPQEGGAVRPHPDDEAWLKDLGYPKLGKDLQSRTTQHEHGPNAGGTQQGDTKAKRPSGSR